MGRSTAQRKEATIKFIEKTWNLVSLDEFLNLPVSVVDPSIISPRFANVILKPDRYSSTFIRSLWFICRNTSPVYPPLDIRRLLAAAVIERLEKKRTSGQYCIRIQSLVFSDLEKVKENLGLSKDEGPEVRDDRGASPVPSEVSESSEESSAEEKVEDTIVARAPTMATTTASDRVSQTNGTSSNQTEARFEVHVPQSLKRPQPATPTPHRPAAAPRPSVSASSPSHQPSRTTAPAVAPATTVPYSTRPRPLATPAPFGQHPPLATPESFARPQSLASPGVANRATASPQQPAVVNQPAPAKRNSNFQPPPTPPDAKSPGTTESNNSQQTTATPAGRPRASATPRERSTDTPRTDDRPNLRRPAPATTPSSKRPWKRARRGRFDEIKAIEYSIRDTKLEIAAFDAQVVMHTTRLKSQRECHDAEKAELDGIQQYLSNETAYCKRTDGYLTVSNKLKVLRDEYPQVFSRDPDPEGLAPPTIPEWSTVESPPDILDKMIASLMTYHQGSDQDLKAARSDFQTGKDTGVELQRAIKTTEQKLLDAHSQRESARGRLGRLEVRLKELEREKLEREKQQQG